MTGPLLGRGFAALAIRNYRLFWIGQGVSRTGSWMQRVSLPWLALALGASPIELGLVAALEFTPALLLAPLGGVYADRLDKRRTILVTQVVATLQVLVLLGLTLTGTITIPLIMALSFGLGILNAIEGPVRQSLVADLVPRGVLANAIALNSMAFNSARVIGPAVAGVTIAAGTALFGSVYAGVAFNLAINATSFGAVLYTVARMDPAQIRVVERPEREMPVFESLREGVGHAARTPIVLWPLLLVTIVSIFADNFRILLPLFTQDVLNLGADAYGGLYGSFGFGALAGALTLAYLSERRVVPFMVGGGLALGSCLLALAFTSTLVLAAVLMVVAGYGLMMLSNNANVAIQSSVPDGVRGRVMALWVMVNQGSVPIGGLVAGAVAEVWGVPAAFLIGGIGAVVATLMVWARLRIVGRAGRLGSTRIGASSR